MSITQSQYQSLNSRLDFIENDMNVMGKDIEALWISRPSRTVPLEDLPLHPWCV